MQYIVNPASVKQLASNVVDLASHPESWGKVANHIAKELEDKLKNTSTAGLIGEIVIEIPSTVIGGYGVVKAGAKTLRSLPVKEVIKTGGLVLRGSAERFKRFIDILRLKPGSVEQQTALAVSELEATGEAVAALVAAPARGNPLRRTGATNGVPVPGGQGLGKLSGKELKVTQGNLAEVEAHLMEFAKRHNNGVHFPENEMMLQRLRDAVRDGKPISGADLAFYTHELHELKNMARLMKDGAKTFDEAYDIAHQAALDAFGIAPQAVYHPDVIRATLKTERGTAYWPQSFLEFWGIK